MSSNIKFPLYSPGINCEVNKNCTIIAADLRKEESTLAVYESKEGKVFQKVEVKYTTPDFASFADLLQSFIEDNALQGVKRLSVAVPGPVMDNICETTNLPWIVNLNEVKEQFNFEKAFLINDLRATAYCLADNLESDFEVLHTSAHSSTGNAAILAPGNGLGEAGLFFDGKFLHPFATEGGHTEFSPRNDFEVGFYHFMSKIHGIVTWESVLNKSGIYNIYRFLRDVGRHREEAWLSEKIQNNDFIDVLVEVGKEKSSRLVTLTLQTYLEYLAREANNLTLKLKATGGLIITGEIIDKIYSLIDKDEFYRNFMVSDKMEHLLRDIPILIMRNQKEILEGAAYYGIFIEDDLHD